MHEPIVFFDLAGQISLVGATSTAMCSAGKLAAGNVSIPIAGSPHGRAA
jgi:hypothetical protein